MSLPQQEASTIKINEATTSIKAGDEIVTENTKIGKYYEYSQANVIPAAKASLSHKDMKVI
ncbi:hypothetical protein [Leptolyngbya sp. 7M]|uniref:hypothetical protein n=1 Tax=Leptolyngbya sp. 7M TaxID=2812896 RepID=UPI001B8D7753|nr:hypothetical protein [Leptolyngbya sp. 7M]QYO67152.1 hypothetical protein JVX88_10305 [Leptolyngbya sp. 7M]